MPSLQVREMPPNVYYKLQKNAEAGHRSLAQEAIVTMAKGLETGVSNTARRNRLLDTIEDNTPVISTDPAFDPARLIREDRDR